MRAPAEWKAKLRWLIRRIVESRPSRRALVSPSRMAARMPWRWARRCGRVRRTGVVATGALDPAAGRRVRALVGVPLVAADLVVAQPASRQTCLGGHEARWR